MGAPNSGPEGLAADERPAFDGAQVAGLPVAVFGIEIETGIDNEVQRGLVLKADVDRMVVACGVDLGVLDDLALHLFEAVELAITIAANCGLAALDDPGWREERERSSFFGFGFTFGRGLAFG